jgi:hypothetical protein
MEFSFANSLLSKLEVNNRLFAAPRFAGKPF